MCSNTQLAAIYCQLLNSTYLLHTISVLSKRNHRQNHVVLIKTLNKLKDVTSWSDVTIMNNIIAHKGFHGLYLSTITPRSTLFHLWNNSRIVLFQISILHLVWEPCIAHFLIILHHLYAPKQLNFLLQFVPVEKHHLQWALVWQTPSDIFLLTKTSTCDTIIINLIATYLYTLVGELIGYMNHVVLGCLSIQLWC